MAMPTVHELSSRVMPVIQRHDSDLANRLTKLGHNVELWMTYLSQEQPWLRVEENQHNLSVAGRIRREIGATVTEHTLQSVSGQPPEWLERLLRLWHDRQSVVVTMNYDTLVERVARGLQVASERPNERFDDPELYEIHLANLYPPYLTFVGGRSGYAVGPPLPRSTFTLLKLPWLHELVLLPAGPTSTARISCTLTCLHSATLPRATRAVTPTRRL